MVLINVTEWCGPVETDLAADADIQTKMIPVESIKDEIRLAEIIDDIRVFKVGF